MADPGIKKLIIPKEDWPPVQFEKIYNEETQEYEIGELFYNFRYRVVSEDRNRYSHWSPITRYAMPNATDPFPYTDAPRIEVSKAGNPEVLTVVWNKPGPEENPTQYEQFMNTTDSFDVWIRWNNNNTSDPNDAGWEAWQFKTTVSTNTFNIIKRDGDVKRLDVAIQIPTIEKVRDIYNNKVTLYRVISGTI